MKILKEFSRAFCCITAIVLMIIGIWMVFRYYNLIQFAIENGSSTIPDASLPIAGVTAIIAPIVSYLLYQWGLKNSRNKYGVDSEGQPFKMNSDGTPSDD